MRYLPHIEANQQLTMSGMSCADSSRTKLIVLGWEVCRHQIRDPRRDGVPVHLDDENEQGSGEALASTQEH